MPRTYTRRKDTGQSGNGGKFAAGRRSTGRRKAVASFNVEAAAASLKRSRSSGTAYRALNGATVANLRAVARTLGIRLKSGMKKEEIRAYMSLAVRTPAKKAAAKRVRKTAVRAPKPAPQWLKEAGRMGALRLPTATPAPRKRAARKVAAPRKRA